MKITHIIYTATLTGTVLLSGTACAGSNGSRDDTKTTAVAKSTEQPSTNATEDTANILKTVNGYYSFISSSENYDKVKSAGAELTGKTANDEQLNSMVSGFHEGYQYFDTSNSQLIKNAYKAMMLGTGSLRMGSPVTITAPADAVSVDGNKATLNTTWISVTENGVAHPTKPESNPDSSDLISLVKKDDGSWVIVAKDSSLKVSAP